jgi:sigma-B regulation protein RsbU (phosphoserine phosphatase)
MRRGAKSFVQKPWDDMTLVEVVRREIAEGRALRRRDAQLAREHDEARLIQRALLPVAMPHVAGCDLAAIWTPAYGIGGDCYDILPFSDSSLAVSIADVVGKGLPAALLMSNLQAAVRAFSTAAIEPQALCTSVNRLLCRNITSGKFVTFCYAVIDMAERCIRHANAGHNPPILMRRSGEVDRLAPTGLVLGIASDWVYASGVTDIHPGDRLVCFTDGITEAASEDGDQFGEDRLMECIAQYRDQPSALLARAISERVTAWTRGSLSDDATLIVAAFA